MKNPWTILALTLSTALLASAHNILDYGAIEGSTEDTARAFINSQAMTRAIMAANQTDQDDKTVLIPYNQTFVMMPVVVNNLYNVSIVIDGQVYASQDYQSWNRSTDGRSYVHFWLFSDCQNLSFTGVGTVDGGGYWWWMREYVQLNKGTRPRLI